MNKEELTKYEVARLLGARSLQLAYGAPPMIKANSDMTFIQIAQEELDKGIIPLTVLRQEEN